MGYLRKIASVIFNRPVFSQRCRSLKGGAGVVTENLFCGCLLKGEHVPEKGIWILTYEYSKCTCGHSKRLKEVK